jgi:hypothetical protein
METNLVIKEAPDIDVSSIVEAQSFEIKDQGDMIITKERILEAQRRKKIIDRFFDEGVGQHGIWRDQKTLCDNTKKIWEEKIRGYEKLIGIYDKKQKDFVRVENEKKRAQEEAIRKELAEQAEEKKADDVADLLLEGRIEDAKELEAKKVVAPIVDLKTEADGVKGQYTRKNWKARVIDASKLPEEYTKRVPDLDKLNAEAKRKEGAFNVSGAEAYDDFSIIRKEL